MLTKRQAEILLFIQSRPFPPTLREIGKHFSIRSPNGVACHLKPLERKGFIDRSEDDCGGKSRAITILRRIYSLPILQQTFTDVVETDRRLLVGRDGKMVGEI